MVFNHLILTHTVYHYLCLLWGNSVHVTVLSGSLHHIHFELCRPSSDRMVMVTRVYGYLEDRNKDRMWRLIEALNPRRGFHGSV